MNNYCPLVNSKCITDECIAYETRMNFVQCVYCDKIYALGLRCLLHPFGSHYEHHTVSYCKHFNKKLTIKVV